MDWDAVLREHEAKLKPGIRVKVRLSGECVLVNRPPHEWYRDAGKPSHHNECDGATGIIDWVQDHEQVPGGHRFVVTLDPPVRFNNGRSIQYADAFSSAELIPLDTDTTT